MYTTETPARRSKVMQGGKDIACLGKSDRQSRRHGGSVVA